MGLETNSGSLIYLNIKEGKIVYKDQSGEKQTCDSVSGLITKVEFANEEYQGNTFEKAKIIITDADEKFMLQMRTDSGYFRGLCNSLRSGNPTGRVKISPSYSETDGKKQTTCFVQQDGAWLKHYFNKNNQGDLPNLEKIQFKGKDQWDGTKQIEYWKNWLLASINGNAPEIKEEAAFITSEDDDMPF